MEAQRSQADKAQKAAALDAAEKALKKLVLDQPALEVIVEIVNVGGNSKVGAVAARNRQPWWERPPQC